MDATDGLAHAALLLTCFGAMPVVGRADCHDPGARATKSPVHVIVNSVAYDTDNDDRADMDASVDWSRASSGEALWLFFSSKEREQAAWALARVTDATLTSRDAGASTMRCGVPPDLAGVLCRSSAGSGLFQFRLHVGVHGVKAPRQFTITALEMAAQSTDSGGVLLSMKTAIREGAFADFLNHTADRSRAAARERVRRYCGPRCSLLFSGGKYVASDPDRINELPVEERLAFSQWSGLPQSLQLSIKTVDW